MKKIDAKAAIIIDCSHANSNKDHRKQRQVTLDIIEQIGQGNNSIAGIMLESFLEEGNQKPEKPKNLKYGVSLTDKCIGWEETEDLINKFAGA